MRISDWSSDVCSSDLDAGNHGFLFDRPSVIGFQYVRNGRPEFFAEFYNSATFYLSHIKTEGRGGGWPDCTGGWEFDGVNEIGRAHVRTPVTNAHLVCRLLLEKNKPSSVHTSNDTTRARRLIKQIR